MIAFYEWKIRYFDLSEGPYGWYRTPHPDGGWIRRERFNLDLPFDLMTVEEMEAEERLEPTAEVTR